MSQNNFFSLIVIGENPQDLMDEYNANKKVEKYIKYRFTDVPKLKENTLAFLTELLKQNNINKTLIEEEIADIIEMSDIEFYSSLTKDLECDDDGNAWSSDNPNGKWTEFQPSSIYSTPLRLLNGQTVFQAKKKNIDWNTMHGFQTDTYSKVWDMIINGKEPSNLHEEILYKNMKDHKDYLLQFKTKDNYIIYNTSYWNYAILNKYGWNDANDKPISDWIKNFYTSFIEPLDDNELITIYEFKTSN